MRYRNLGRSGLIVSELCLGTMTFGGGEGMWQVVGQLKQDEADALVKASLDAGINFIDTANVYSEGQSETILGQSLKNLGVARDTVVVATKVLGRMGKGPNAAGASRGHILDQVEHSLKRLQLDHIDLYQIHGVDPSTPIEETIEALDSLVRRGIVRYIGLSNWAAWQIAKAVGIAERRNLARPTSLQAYYTIAGRDLEREIVPMMQSEGVGLMVWSPLAGGLLSGKYSRDDEKGDGGRRASFDFPPVDKERAYDIIDAMKSIAEAKGLHGRPGRDRLAAPPERGDQRHHRREAARAAPGQSRRGRRGAERGGSRRARRGQQADARISGLDDRAAGDLPLRRRDAAAAPKS